MRRGRIAVALVVMMLLAGCGLTLPGASTAVSTPSTYSVKVGAARTLAIRELRAEAVNDWSTMYEDRKASACFAKHWPTLGAYKHWWTSNWGPVNSGPGDLPSATEPIKVLSGAGDSDHQIVVLESLDPTFINPFQELDVLRRFSAGWAILNWLPYLPSHVSNGSAPYRVSNQRWDPCYSAMAYTPGMGP